VNTLIPILAAIVLAAAFVGMVLQRSLGAQLRRQYPKLWESLEESSCVFMTLQRFLWLRRYRALDDAGLAARAAWLRGYWIALFTALVGVVLLFCLDFANK
jgi:hypothetical protein